MLRTLPRACLPALAFCLSVLPVAAENWPQWRGPNLNGSSAEKGLPSRFSPTENVKWTLPMPGPGAATPIVWGNHVFVSSTDSANHALVALCIDAETGAVLWTHNVGTDRKAPRNNMASPSAVTDGQLVCFTYGTGLLVAFDLDGREQWRRELEEDYGVNALMFGYSSSPLLYKGSLVVCALRNSRPDRYARTFPAGASRAPVSSYVAAIDLQTGKSLWRQDRGSDAVKETVEAYTTPIPFPRAGGSTEILVLGADCLSAHDPATGNELWRWSGYNPQKITHWRMVTSPVTCGSRVFVTAPKHAPLYAVAPAARGQLGIDQVDWQYDLHTPDASTPLLYDGRLYALQDDGRLISCLDPDTGAVKWRESLGGYAVFRASLTGADGKLFAMNEKAEVTVLQAGDEFQLLHRTEMGAGPARSTIAVGAGCLFIRTAATLYCIDE